jgi:ribose transport system permease protein
MGRASASEITIEGERRSRPGSALFGRFRAALISYIGLVAVLVALCVFYSVTLPRFMTYENVINIAQTNAVMLIVAIGLMFPMISGGFDISTGGVLVLSGVVLGQLLVAGVPVAVAALISVAGGAAFGLCVNGLLIARVGLNFFVVTLGTMSITKSLALKVSNGESRGLYDQASLRSIGNGTVAGIPAPVIVACGVALIAAFVLRYTGFGRMVYALGGNEEASRVAGINTVAIKASVYAICSGCAALAGVIECGRLAAASPTTDTGIELQAAAAVLLGGAAFTGGSGTVLGSVLGVVFLGTIQNGLLLGSVSIYWQGAITGTVLIASVVVDRMRRVRTAKRTG